MLVDDLKVGGVAGTARAAHVRMNHRDRLAQVPHVRGARPVPRLAAGAGTEDGVGILFEHARQRGVRAQRQVTRQGLDLDAGAEAQAPPLSARSNLMVASPIPSKGPPRT